MGARGCERTVTHAVDSRLSGWEAVVTFFCFLDSDHVPMAHMEPLDAETLEEARQQASHLLRQHHSAKAARIFLDAVEVDILEAKGEPS